MIRLPMKYGLEDLILSNTSVFVGKCYIKNNDEHLGKYDDRADEDILL